MILVNESSKLVFRAYIFIIYCSSYIFYVLFFLYCGYIWDILVYLKEKKNQLFSFAVNFRP